MLELMHFADELVEVDEFRTPRATTPGKKELEMAKHLVASMTSAWDPEAYQDEYTEGLQKVIDEKVKAGGKALPAAGKRRRPANVIDLVEALQQSLAATPAKRKRSAPAKKPRRRKAG
jgi:DNA end-binding protein Ku